MHYAAHHIASLLRVLVYIDDHLQEPLKLEKMAKIAHISPFYFHRLFQAYTGKTLAEYVKELRLQRAEGHLQYSDTPITDIALDVGYETPSSFTKVFNQVLGKSPRQYRKVMQPVVEAMIRRTTPTKAEKEMLRPKYVTRKELPVLFVRSIGDYAITPPLAFEALSRFLQEEQVKKEEIVGYYSMGLDDPHIVERSKCRFDVCVALKIAIPSKGAVGKKILPAGRFALFIHRGPYSEIENSLKAIFRCWYPSSTVELADLPPLCEMTEDESVTKLYIPLIK